MGYEQSPNKTRISNLFGRTKTLALYSMWQGQIVSGIIQTIEQRSGSLSKERIDAINKMLNTVLKAPKTREGLNILSAQKKLLDKILPGIVRL